MKLYWIQWKDDTILKKKMQVLQLIDKNLIPYNYVNKIRTHA